MNKIKIFWLLLLYLTFSSVIAFAHVAIDYPTGNENFLGYEVVEIQWHVAVYHGPANWDLLFSSDGGESWEAIVSDLPESQLAYEFSMPNLETDAGKIRIVQDNGGLDYVSDSGDFSIAISSEATDEIEMVDKAILYSAYPNPFNPSGAGRSPATTISYYLPEPDRVNLKIYNMLGQEIKTLVDEKNQVAGNNSIMWDGRDYSNQTVSSGIYFYRIEIGNFKESKRIIMLK